MSVAEILTPETLTPISSPYREPRLAAAAGEPRLVNNLSLLNGKTFLATTVSGDIAPSCSTDVGFFYQDTRFLSYMELRVNGHRTVVLSSGTQNNLISQIELTTSKLVVRESLDLPENTVHIRREQVLGGCFFDRLSLENFNLESVELTLELCFDADFADVFQVRGMPRHETGTYYKPVVRQASLSFAYQGLDRVFRQTLIEFDPPPAELDDHGVRYHVSLKPQEKLQITLSVQPLVDGKGPESEGDFRRSLESRRRQFHAWSGESTSFESSNQLFDECLSTASSDFFALRIPYSPHGEIIAAGIPWFATIFGRDSLIAAYQSLMVHSRLARQTLRFLGRHQGTAVNLERDEQPGKILHEMREGEMTRSGAMPFSPYYGSIDSTPLFLIVLGETYNWTGDDELMEELLPAARRALEWIENYGDIDGDGFVEYQRQSSRGLANQGWKDSWDSSLDHNGKLLDPPIALCEAQGYCYDARYRLARLLRIIGDSQTADRLRQACSELARNFERAFWMEEQNYYAMSLDGHKRQQQVISSNAGHLLWSRIINKDRARLVAHRMMREDMFSGWGVRTLSANEPTFNPLSYHRGSVWPHDNSLIAQGLAWYDFKQPLNRILTGLFQAATHFRNLRLPELFVGVQRRDIDQPVHYPVSCSPQAWASGALFLMLTAILGLRPNAARRELRIVNPLLPDWLDWLRLRNLQVGNAQVTLEFSRRNQRTFCNVLDVQGDRLVVSVDFTK